MTTLSTEHWQGVTGLLSPRELDFTLRVAEGKTDKQIAKEVGLAPDSVRKRVYSAMFKLGASRRAQLVAEAMRRAIITPLLLLIVFAMTAVQATPDHQPVHRTRIVRVKGGGRRDDVVSVFRIC